MIGAIDRLELVYLAAGVVCGFAVMLRALQRAHSVTSRRQLGWIVSGTVLGGLPFVLCYGVPFALGADPWPRAELLAVPLGLVPLAFASAVVRYRLMDVEVIVKRGIVYATAVSAIVAIYAVVLKLAAEFLIKDTDEHITVIAVLATLVVVLLAPLVKNAVQTTLDRAYYRERYDYRRALVAFARDLNSDLDLDRLGTRLVERVRKTLALERMALLIAPVAGAGEWVPLSAEGWRRTAAAGHSERCGRPVAGRHSVSLDDLLTARRLPADEIAQWRDIGLYYFVPCVSKEGTTAVMALGPKESGEPLNSEDMSLLAAVAGQVATSLENGRLYHQLRMKADELSRLRQFSENIIASLNEGLLVVGLDDRVVRWNAAMEQLYGLSRSEVVGQPLGTLFDGAFVSALAVARADSESGTLFRVPLRSRHGVRGGAGPAGQRGGDAAAHARRRRRGDES